jgi:hypothetical protein
LGIGLDGDGEVRVTRGENFALVGGSHGTHEAMQETCIRVNEKLAERGQTLEDLGREELSGLVRQCAPRRGRPKGA